MPKTLLFLFMLADISLVCMYWVIHMFIGLWKHNLASHEKFYSEVGQSWWKTITKLNSKEIPKIEKKRKKDKAKKPSIGCDPWGKIRKVN